MKLFRIRGGVHPQGRKELSCAAAIESLPLPQLLRIPLQQHIGVAATPLVKKGEKVLKGQLLAAAQGPLSAPVHAPTSGTVVTIGNYLAPHPSGLPLPTITLRPDGEDRWGPLPSPIDPFQLTATQIAERVAAAGVVGMGGATFPSAVKLSLGERYTLDTLVINAAECEPYLTCDDRLMQEQPNEVIDGVRIMMHALGTQHAIIALENNKPAAFAALSAVAKAQQGIEVVQVPTRYPMGSEKHLVQTLTGKETPARGLTADIGVVVHNPATAFAVQEAVRYGRPLIERVVTVSGGAIQSPRNLRVAIGTPIADLIDYCGGYNSEPARLLSGGPMMGQPIRDIRIPVVKGCNGVLALTSEEAGDRPSSPCIRCGKCVEVCPCGLVPLTMAANIRHGELQRANEYGVTDCLSCGSCSYACPSHIPLVQYFNYAKGELNQRRQAEQKQATIKQLIADRSARVEKAQQAKREAMRQRREAAKQKDSAEEANL